MSPRSTLSKRRLERLSTASANQSAARRAYGPFGVAARTADGRWPSCAFATWEGSSGGWILAPGPEKEILDAPPEEYPFCRPSSSTKIGKGARGGARQPATLWPRAERLPIVYVTKGSKIPQEAIAQVKQAVPQMRIEPRGERHAGGFVHPRPHLPRGAPSPPTRRQIKPEFGTADRICEIRRRGLDEFQATGRDHRGDHKPGDKVVVEVAERGDEKITVEAQLTGCSPGVAVRSQKIAPLPHGGESAIAFAPGGAKVMHRSYRRPAIVLLCTLALLLPRGRELAAADLSAKEVLDAIDKAKQTFLKAAARPNGAWKAEGGYANYEVGVTSLALMALINTGMSVTDPEIQRGLNWLRTTKPPSGTYEISLMIQALAAARDGQGRDLGIVDHPRPRPRRHADSAGTQYGIVGIHQEPGRRRPQQRPIRRPRPARGPGNGRSRRPRNMAAGTATLAHQPEPRRRLGLQ